MLQIDRQFDSLSEWLHYSETNLMADAPDSQRASVTTPSEFTGVKCKAEAYSLIRNGYPEGRELMEKMLGKISTISLKTVKEEFSNAVEGCAPNVEAYVQGLPEDMFTFSPVECEAPPSVLTVQFEMAFAARVTKSVMALAGAVIFAAMEELRAQGCAVIPLITWTSALRHGQSADAQYTLPLPPNLDIDTFAFMFTHPAAYRVIQFSVTEHECERIRYQFGYYSGGGYAYASEQKRPESDVSLKLMQICNRLENSNSIESACQILRNLVDSKFTKL